MNANMRVYEAELEAQHEEHQERNVARLNSEVNVTPATATLRN